MASKGGGTRLLRHFHFTHVTSINRVRPNGPRYRRLDGLGLAHETDKTQGHEKSQFGGENPAVRVHALLARFRLMIHKPLARLAGVNVA